MKALSRSTASSWSRAAGGGVLLLLAFALRVYLLDHQSMWADEGNSAAMAPRALLDILRRTAQDIHPPLYYILLHYWGALGGTSVFALRAFSVFCGVVAVALTYRLGGSVSAATGSHTVGRVLPVMSALLLAVSPFAIHYSQEMRMYMLVTTLGAASWVAWFRWDGLRLDWRAGAYVLVTLALLYSHYYAASLLVAQNIAWLLARSDRGTPFARRMRVWIGMQAMLVAAYLPWLWYARATILNWPSISAPVSIRFILAEVPRIFTLGPANEGMPGWLRLLVTLLFLAGLYGALRTRRGSAVLLYFAVPPVLMLLLSIDRPFWNPKFLLLALPGFLLTLGCGVAQCLVWGERQWSWGKKPTVQRAILTMVIGLFAVATVPALVNEYHNPRYARDDYRAIARAIESQADASDAILLDGAGQREIFSYYYHGELPVYGLPDTQPLDPEKIQASLETIVSEHGQLWVVWWAEEEADPDLVIPRWLNGNAFPAESRWYGNVRLERYTTGAPPLVPVTQVADTGTENTVLFAFRPGGQGFAIDAVGSGPNPVTAGHVIAVYASATAHTLARGEPLPGATFFAQLLDAADHVIGQYDGDAGAPPAGGWSQEQALSLRMGIPIPIGTIPGEYRILIGAYDPATGQRYLTPTGDALSVGTVQVNAPPEPPDVASISLPGGKQVDQRFGTLQLVAARVNRIGYDHAPDTPLRPGEPFSTLLYWQIRGREPALPVLTVRLVDSSGLSPAHWELVPGENRYPLDQWRLGDVLRDPHTIFLPGDLPAGRYDVVVGDGQHDVNLGTLLVEG